MNIRILSPEEMIETEVSLPLSKSMYNRAALMRALTPGSTLELAEPPCDDARAIISAIASTDRDINIGPAGTAMRFLTAYYAAKPGCDVVLDGDDRMRQRPIGILVDALRRCGADIEYAGTEGYAPLHIKGTTLHGGTFDIDSTVSSQYISALMMVAPTFSSPLILNLTGEISSLPYIKMTLGMMRNRGIHATLIADTVTVNPGTYRDPASDDIEADWSAASYWYSIAALSAGWITLKGLELPSLQGDSRVADIFVRLGVITNTEDAGSVELSASPEVFSHLDIDLADTPDLVPALAVVCCMIGVPFHFTGVKSLRIKETDRLEALRAELLKLGFVIEIPNDNEIKWHSARVPVTEMPRIATYGDHRMAMAFAPAAMYISGLEIENAQVVSKSYPRFWDDMIAAGFTIQQENDE